MAEALGCVYQALVLYSFLLAVRKFDSWAAKSQLVLPHFILILLKCSGADP